MLLVTDARPVVCNSAVGIPSDILVYQLSSVESRVHFIGRGARRRRGRDGSEEDGVMGQRRGRRDRRGAKKSRAGGVGKAWKRGDGRKGNEGEVREVREKRQGEGGKVDTGVAGARGESYRKWSDLEAGEKGQ